MKYLVSFSWVITIIDFLSLEKQQGMLCIPQKIVIQVFGSSRSQMFFKIGLLENCNIHRKAPALESYLMFF